MQPQHNGYFVHLIMTNTVSSIQSQASKNNLKYISPNVTWTFKACPKKANNIIKLTFIGQTILHYHYHNILNTDKEAIY